MPNNLFYLSFLVSFLLIPQITVLANYLFPLISVCVAEGSPLSFLDQDESVESVTALQLAIGNTCQFYLLKVHGKLIKYSLLYLFIFFVSIQECCSALRPLR